MEYKIYKDYGSKEEAKPSFLLGDVFYKPSIGYFREHAATLIIEGDKYRIEGKDEKIKGLLKIEIEMHSGKSLSRDGEGFYDEEARCYVDFDVSTPFDHPEFKKALSDTLRAYGYSAVSPEVFNMVQVSSLEEAQRLRREYLEEREKKLKV